MAGNIGKNLKVGERFHAAVAGAAKREKLSLRAISEKIVQLWLAKHHPDLLIGSIFGEHLNDVSAEHNSLPPSGPRQQR